MQAAINSLFLLSWSLSLLAQTAPPAALEEARQAAALVQTGKPEQAVPIFRRLLAEHPQDDQLRLNLTIALYKAGDYQGTAKQAEALVEREPDQFAGWLFLGAARTKLGDAASAEAPLRKALELNPSDINARLLLADALAEQKKLSDAVQAYSTVAERLPQLPRAWFGVSQGYADLALESLTNLERSAPDSSEALALAGDFAAHDAQLQKAFLDYRQALRSQPGFPGIHAKIADLYDLAGHPEWAVMERRKPDSTGGSCAPQSSIECDFLSGKLTVAAASDTHSSADIYWQAQAFLALSQEAYTRLLSLPPSPERYQAQARHEEQRGRYPEAVASWQEALRLDPANLGLLRGLALADCHSNDCVSALPLLREAVAKYPSSPEWNYLYGLALVTVREPLPALGYLQKALHLDPSFSSARGVLGEAYLEAGRPADAIDPLKEALVGDEKGTRHYQLAQAYRALGKDKEAREMLAHYRQMLQELPASEAAASALSPP